MQHLDLLLQIQTKHLQHTNETPETYSCNMHVMQHLDLLLQHPDETLEKYACKMKHMIATCVYSHCNIYNV
jgi:hypothetical protein